MSNGKKMKIKELIKIIKKFLKPREIVYQDDLVMTIQNGVGDYTVVFKKGIELNKVYKIYEPEKRRSFKNGNHN